MKKALKIGIMGMIGFMLFVYTFYGSRVDEEGMPCLVLDYNTPPKWLGY